MFIDQPSILPGTEGIPYGTFSFNIRMVSGKLGQVDHPRTGMDQYYSIQFSLFYTKELTASIISRPLSRDAWADPKVFDSWFTVSWNDYIVVLEVKYRHLCTHLSQPLPLPMFAWLCALHCHGMNKRRIFK